ncbi:MAG: hypothetical protein OSA81_10920 [Longimicrobiales bacterium]|nr:hypothetical protein [Longimicrobiales bacterium]
MKRTAAALVLALSLVTTPVLAQTPGPDVGDGVRFGISIGGSSTIALNVELFRNSSSLDFALGTWRFKDVSFSTVLKRYFGAAAAKPVVGAGAWLVRSGGPPNQRTGWALVFRAPIGVDWKIHEPHAIGVFLNVNRALWIRRNNPDDTSPSVGRLVPLPEMYYRIGR